MKIAGSILIMACYTSLALAQGGQAPAASVPAIATAVPSENVQSSVTQSAVRMLPPQGVADHRNVFTSGLRASELGSGLTFSYQRILGGHIALGTSFAGTADNNDREGGSLDLAQYYKEELNLKSFMADLTATYYFRENGYGRWGFLLRGGIGHAWNRATAKWGRYDRNPSVIIIGDEKRLRESGETSMKWQSTYARLGAYYQFVWGFKPTSRLGQVLELGIGGIITDQDKVLSYTKPNGEEINREIPNSAGMAEISYSLAF